MKSLFIFLLIFPIGIISAQNAVANDSITIYSNDNDQIYESHTVGYADDITDNPFLRYRIFASYYYVLRYNSTNDISTFNRMTTTTFYVYGLNIQENIFNVQINVTLDSTGGVITKDTSVFENVTLTTGPHYTHLQNYTFTAINGGIGSKFKKDISEEFNFRITLRYSENHSLLLDTGKIMASNVTVSPFEQPKSNNLSIEFFIIPLAIFIGVIALKTKKRFEKL